MKYLMVMMMTTTTVKKMKKAGKKETKLKSLSAKLKEEEDASKAELELLLADDHRFENGVRGYNLKAKKSKGRKQDVLSEDKLPTVDCDDPRFSALFTSHHFAIDPTDPQFKRSATYSRRPLGLEALAQIATSMKGEL